MSTSKSSRSPFFHSFKKNSKENKPPNDLKISDVTTLSGAAVLAGTSATSGGASGSDNSAATSRNLQNASKQLDDYLKEMDTSDEKLGDVISMSRFIEKAEAYSNSAFKGCFLRQVNMDTSTLILVDLAAKSAKKVYNKSGAQDLEPFAFEQVGESKAVEANTFGGSVKAASVSLHRARGAPSRGPADDIRVMVVAIRGTASIHDWLVNFNDAGNESSVSEDADASVTSDFLGLTEDERPYKIHAGFLACAKLMAPKIASLMTDLLTEANCTRRPVLVFTGHSAGGAVATLLYAHMLKPSIERIFTPLLDRFATCHCITYGAPPITSPRLAPFFALSTFIAFVNEGDPIPRCDGEYVNSLLRLWVSPMPKAEVEWLLPEPVLENAGTVVGIPIHDDGQGNTIFVVLGEEGVDGITGRVFGNPKAHKMDAYLRKLRIAKVVEE